jgi:serine-aspartate repeat-containing protein C/D/E
VVDARDADFSKLLVWQDSNGNHATDAGELRTLGEAGLASLNVSNTMQSEDQLGNVLGERSSATRADGSQAAMVDVYFNYDPADAALPNLGSVLSASNGLLDGAFGTQIASADTSANSPTIHASGDEAEALRRLTALAA